MKKRFMLVLLSLVLTIGATAQAPISKREFRGAWIQMINGQFQGLSPEAMRENLTQQLDAMKACRVNAIMFQVRGEADAMYRSPYEPWSRFLTGKQGQAPMPLWDPLEWMVKECHKRGMEIHAWINPYRAKTSGTKDLARKHPYTQHPERFIAYGNLLLFDPALPENRAYICKVVDDIVRRYDVDGLHIDDYFYPYSNGTEFADNISFSKYANGFTDKGDWRRNNVNKLIEQLQRTIKHAKPWVKFGVSPFGIYHNERNGSRVPGSKTNGTQNYDDLYSDVLLWVNKGWVDYVVPQIYWQIGHPVADYNTLAHWWNKYAGNRPLFFGQDVLRSMKYADPIRPNVHQLPAKFNLERQLPNVKGYCLWYSAVVAKNENNCATLLRKVINPYPALQPQMPFISKERPGKVRRLKTHGAPDGLYLFWQAPKAKKELEKAKLYVVYKFKKGERRNIEDASKIVAITPNTIYRLPYNGGKEKFVYVVTALNRLQNESKTKSKKVKL